MPRRFSIHRQPSKGPSPGKNAPDDFFDGDLPDVNVADGQFVQQGFAGGNHPVALDFEPDAARGLLDDFAVLAHALGGKLSGGLKTNSYQFGIREAVHDVAEPAIEENRAVVNDDDAL